MWWMLLGCPFVGVVDYQALQDIDEDGIRDERFDGRDCDSANPAVGDCDADADGARRPPFGNDCDDDDPAVNPSAPELCNGKDDDCDGRIDDAASISPDQLATFWIDADGDTFGDEPVLACTVPTGAAIRSGDCDDNDATVNPAADELCDPIDQDCDGDPTANAIDRVPWFSDADHDGFGAGAVVATSCEPPADTGPAGDCDDTSARVNPAARELCNGLDDDCDNAIDDDDGDVVVDRVWTLDRDEDAFGAPGTEIGSCSDPSTPTLTYVLNAPADCDDQDATVQQDRPWWPDTDLDGYGDDAALPTLACLPPAQHAAIPGDCNDGDVAVNPAGQEICNGLDDDCDGTTDEGSSGQAWFRDDDGDGYGDHYGDHPTPPVFACAPPTDGTYTLLPGDCDDSDDSVNPIAVERCGNGVDDDCDDTIDADDSSAVTERYYLDTDGDGHGRDDVSAVSCGAPSGFVLEPGDCNDNDPTLYRSLTLFPNDDATLQEIVDETCTSGTVLITDDAVLGTITLPERRLQIRGIDENYPTIGFDPSLTDDPSVPEGTYLFAVPTGGHLTLANLRFQGVVDGVPEARGLVKVIGGGEAVLSDLDIDQVEFHTTMLLQGPRTEVQLERVHHTGLRTGTKGLHWVQSRAKLTVLDSSYTSVDTGASLSNDDAVLVFSTLADSILFQRVVIDDSATTAGATLLRLAGQPLEPTVLKDVTVTHSGRLLSLQNHDVELVRNRLVDVGGPNTVVNDPLPQPSAPWTCTTDASPMSTERDLMIVAGDSSVDVRNTELIHSGSMCIQDEDSTLQLDQSAIALPEQGIARGVSTACALFSSRVSLPAALTNSVVVQEDPSHSPPLFRDSSGAPAAIPTLSNVSTTHADQMPHAGCLVISTGTNTERTLADMELVSPRTTVDPADREDWVLHSFLDTCGTSSSPLQTREQGVSFGADADPRWQLDLDNDQTADGWERFWFGSTDSCSETAAYWDGEVPTTLSPPECPASTVVECPAP